MSFDIRDVALDYLRAGISIIPLRCDGSKAPFASWQTYQKQYATEDQVEQWFSRRCAIGIICGEISGGLEVMDFDDGSLFPAWFDKVASIACRLPIVETPSDGYHVLYRCDAIGHNAKIATDPKRQKGTMIETRGEGGYVVGCGSPLGTHERKGRTYIQAMGPALPEIPRITPSERRELWAVARSFHQGPPQKPQIQSRYTQTQPKKNFAQLDVVDQFNQSPDWATVLPGWTSRDGIHWTRPGKKYGCSAKTCTAHDGTPILTVYTSNTDLKPQSYNAFDLLVKNCFQGNRQAALEALRGWRQ